MGLQTTTMTQSEREGDFPMSDMTPEKAQALLKATARDAGVTVGEVLREVGNG
jgi:hypothetical protein